MNCDIDAKYEEEAWSSTEIKAERQVSYKPFIFFTIIKLLIRELKQLQVLFFRM